MKKMITVLFGSLFLVTLFTTTTNAQFHLRLGPQVGLNYNIGTGSDL